MFAAQLAGKGHVLWGTFDRLAAADEIDALFDAAAGDRKAAIAVLVWVRTQEQLADQLVALAQGERWDLTEETPEGLDTRDVLLGVSWETRDGLQARPMGLAPFATMPVPRRAPYACLATWPGGHANPFWTKWKPNTVDLLDTDMESAGIDEAHHKKLWTSSACNTAKILAEPADDASHYRTVAFRLQAGIRGRITDAL